ncbi:XRE family transcriptional regulator [Sporolactobacillus shoreae]|uniref:XRE family transcriptional regulator n=1 Tax=Sporolactobacillus shoreae TaxID=1465501 RepID=A0A4Z0GUI1_9BACL|nr:helix-turn-helix transcriptional regulator [Sporolactobacillus shoreae]TGB00368.1 XRE family transcriptional regulator [Sporolactobacillus shoreae]
MSDKVRHEALSSFLKKKRALISPQSAGFPIGVRRRTPGLRREEVAQLANVSTTWYTWLEQGRDIKVSSIVLDSVSSALQLTEDERTYLYNLALDVNAKLLPKKTIQTKINPSLKTILKALNYCPAVVTDRYCQIVGWNAAAAYVFLDFEQIPIDQRNLIRLLFTRKELKSLAVNWGHFVRGFLAIFRVYYGRYVEDEWYKQFIDHMSLLHPEFQPLWQQSEVNTAPDVLIEFRHSKAGKMEFNLTSLEVQGNADLRLSIYTPVPETSTEKKLREFVH